MLAWSYKFASYTLATLVASSLWIASSASAIQGEVVQIHLPEDKVEHAFTPRRISLFVGIREFSDPAFRALKYPEKDVADFASFLRENNANESDIHYSLTGKAATADAFVKALDELEAQNTSEDDIIIVYLSTHGTLAYENAQTLKRYAVFSDTEFDNVDQTGIAMDYIQSRLSRLKSKRKAAIFALCHSGAGKSQLPPHIEKELASLKGFFAQPLHEVSSAIMILSASSWGQPAREDNELQNDIYTHFLLRGLKSHDTNKDGAVSLFEAHEYARSMTYNFTRGKQTPTALLNLSGTDPIILKGKIITPSGPLIFADSDRFRDLQLAVNGESKGTLWNPQQLDSGRVRLTLVDPRNPSSPLMDHHVYLKNGTSYPISELFARQPTIGFEARSHSVPLALDGLDVADLVLPEIYSRFTEILGTRIWLGMGGGVRNVAGEIPLEIETANLDISVAHARLDVGYVTYPTQSQSVSVGLGLEFLSIKRIIDNEAFLSKSQKASLVYPTLVADWRLLNLFGSSYVGVFSSVVPSRATAITIDGESHPLRPLTGGGIMGLSF